MLCVCAVRVSGAGPSAQITQWWMAFTVVVGAWAMDCVLVNGIFRG
jgi:hypothetical protein